MIKTSSYVLIESSPPTKPSLLVLLLFRNTLQEAKDARRTTSIVIVLKVAFEARVRSKSIKPLE
jgi:hypothetical protein